MSTKNGAAQKTTVAQSVESKRKYLSQSDVPNYSLDDALAIPRALFEHYGGKSATPLQVAQALNVSPSSGHFRMLCGASIAYGLTSGGYNATEIAPEQPALRIFKMQNEGDDLIAKVECFLKPRIIKEFFLKYDRNAIPREDIAKNVLESFGVPADKLAIVHDLIINQGSRLGLVVELKGKKYVQLNSTRTPISESIQPAEDASALGSLAYDASTGTITDIEPLMSHNGSPKKVEVPITNEKLKRVFITHGKNTKFIDPIKKLLSFGELQAVVSVEKTTISQPVPDKVMNDMRSCGAAIIHVEDELKLIDDQAEEHLIINPNVLIEIGAAMALFGRRFILLVKDGIKLPSNLQGLFEVRYSGDQLDGTATIKLLEAINDIKNQSLPSA